MIQRDIDRQEIADKTKDFLKSGGVINMLPNWVGNMGYNVTLNNRDKNQQKARERAAKVSGRAPKPPSIWHDPTHKNELDF